MALVKCPECGREKVSSTALTCPDCGYGIKEHFEKNPKELYINETSVSYSDLLTLKKESIFENGLEDGAKGKCIEGTLVWEYYVEKDILYVTRSVGTVPYKIVGDLLINLNGKQDGYIPEQDSFTASCTSEFFMGGTEKKQFNEDCSYTETNPMNGQASGYYKRKGDLIAIKSRSTGNEAHGFVIYENCLYIASDIKTESSMKMEELLDELNSDSYIPSANNVPVYDLKKTAVEIKCPYCQSNNTKKIGIIGRSLSFGLFGFGSSKVGKQWHCNACNSDF